MKQLTILLSLSFMAVFSSAQSVRLVERVAKKGAETVIPYEKYILSNGLTILLTEDHSDPIVHVDITYHVGSAREEIGKSGFAHFFEHMMFEGSDHVKSGDHFKIVSGSGGDLNGSTGQDVTNYYETVPSNQLQKIIWLEADRMGFLLNAVTQRKFEIQRSTVKNERGENYDNQPYGLALETISKSLYPYGHPYSWLTIGYVEDLNKVDVSDLKRFFLRWYSPNNATLTIGGDIDPKQTLSWVKKYFGTIPAGPVVKPTVLPQTVLKSNRYISYTDNYANQPLLLITYPGVKMYHKDQAALNALSMIIGQSANSLLYKNFIKPRIASQASMQSSNVELAGYIALQVIPYPGHSLADMKTMLDNVFVEFEKRGVSNEDLARFKGAFESSYISSISGISGKVGVLAAAQTYTGNPNQIGRELAEIRGVTKEDVMRVYNQYIKQKSRVILSILPKSTTEKPAAPDNFIVKKDNYKAPDYGYKGLTYHPAKDNFDRNVAPPAGPNPVVKVPPFWKATIKNGIPVIGSFNNEIPEVSIRISIKGGGLLAAKHPDKAGLPSIVAQMLNNDTQTMTAEELSSKLAILGSSVRFYTNGEETALTITSLTNNIDQTLALAKDRLFNPRFTQDALDRIKKQMIQNLQFSKTEPASVASSVFNKILFGNDNIRTFGTNGNEKTIQSITLEDVERYYSNNFGADVASVIIVGDITQDAAMRKLEFLSRMENKNINIPIPSKPDKTPTSRTIYIVDIPGAAQSEIRMGYYTGVKFDPTGLSYRLDLANFALGGGFNSRLNIDLREEKGWTYGANSAFVSGKYDGWFVARAGIRAASTDSAALEFVKDLQAYVKDGITDKELEFTKNAIGQSEALNYETNMQKAAFLSMIQDYNLSPDFVSRQADILKVLEKQQVNGLSGKYLDPDQMTMLIVGDKASFLPELRKTGYKIVELDADGNDIKMP